MITYLSKFIPNLSSLTALLRELLKKDVWHWSSSDLDKAIDDIKKVIPQKVTLSYFDVSQPVVIQTDASSLGLGSCLLQNGKPTAFALRSLTYSEKNYAEIEKELLAIIFLARSLPIIAMVNQQWFSQIISRWKQFFASLLIKFHHDYKICYFVCRGDV